MHHIVTVRTRLLHTLTRFGSCGASRETVVGIALRCHFPEFAYFSPLRTDPVASLQILFDRSKPEQRKNAEKCIREVRYFPYHRFRSFPPFSVLTVLTSHSSSTLTPNSAGANTVATLRRRTRSWRPTPPETTPSAVSLSRSRTRLTRTVRCLFVPQSTSTYYPLSFYRHHGTRPCWSLAEELPWEGMGDRREKSVEGGKDGGREIVGRRRA
jgi:hypothetical protein